MANNQEKADDFENYTSDDAIKDALRIMAEDRVVEANPIPHSTPQTIALLHESTKILQKKTLFSELIPLLSYKSEMEEWAEQIKPHNSWGDLVQMMLPIGAKDIKTAATDYAYRKMFVSGLIEDITNPNHQIPTSSPAFINSFGKFYELITTATSTYHDHHINNWSVLLESFRYDPDTAQSTHVSFTLGRQEGSVFALARRINTSTHAVVEASLTNVDSSPFFSGPHETALTCPLPFVDNQNDKLPRQLRFAQLPRTTLTVMRGIIDEVNTLGSNPRPDPKLTLLNPTKAQARWNLPKYHSVQST